MRDRPTPETDDAQFGTGRVSVDFARDLERQRDELTELVAKWRDMTPEEMRLRAGDMTAQEVRSVKAVLNAILPNSTALPPTVGSGESSKQWNPPALAE